MVIMRLAGLGADAAAYLARLPRLKRDSSLKHTVARFSEGGSRASRDIDDSMRQLKSFVTERQSRTNMFSRHFRSNNKVVPFE